MAAEGRRLNMTRNIAVGIVLLAGALLTASCAKADGIFTATLLGSGEVPPTGSSATGFITVTLTGNILSLLCRSGCKRASGNPLCRFPEYDKRKLLEHLRPNPIVRVHHGLRNCQRWDGWGCRERVGGCPILRPDVRQYSRRYLPWRRNPGSAYTDA